MCDFDLNYLDWSLTPWYLRLIGFSKYRRVIYSDNVHLGPWMEYKDTI